MNFGKSVWYNIVILLEPRAVESIILVAKLALHNMLITSSIRGIYCPTGLTDTEDVNREPTCGVWRNDMCTDSMLALEIQAKRNKTSIEAKDNSFLLDAVIFYYVGFSPVI